VLACVGPLLGRNRNGLQILKAGMETTRRCLVSMIVSARFGAPRPRRASRTRDSCSCMQGATVSCINALCAHHGVVGAIFTMRCLAGRTVTGCGGGWR
jgi:hypothetical protein